jgi:FAD/FMN-containing dehydrogenase
MREWRMPNFARARLLFASFTIALTLSRCAVVHLVRTAAVDRPATTKEAPGTIDDASRLNSTTVRGITEIAADDAVAVVQIRAAFERARATSTKVSIAGFRHSMGGQTITPDGEVLDMLGHNRIELRGDVLHAQAGAVWKDIIEYLETRGRSVAVMQSDSPFTVGGSLSVNCHGWQHDHEPVAATVEAMTVILPNGEVLRTSRTENAALFRLILGGYGLFGVILDADLRTVPNEAYRAQHAIVDVASYERLFDERVRHRDDVGLAYGRISVAPATFVREAILTSYVRDPGPPPSLAPLRVSKLERLVFRGSVGSDYGKNLRWRLERLQSRRASRRPYSRNQLLHQTIDAYVDRSASSTDILHEYFVPRGKLDAFVERIKPILQGREGLDLLNITVRDVRKDTTTALPYAKEDVFAVVMFFSQKRSSEAEEVMRDVTRELINAALDLGGTYYLPYRLHATQEQFERAYPEWRDFFEAKRKFDPDEILSNLWYQRYGRP